MSDIIDLKDALERVQDDKELLLELFEIFQEDFPGKRDAFLAAFTKGDANTFRLLAHGLKGATGNISARQMHENCIELDRMGKEGDLTGAGERLELLDKQYAAFKAEAAKLKAQFGK
jgi:HPt (histidine-containing phosphotransfer) domain-containing protein